MNESLLHEFASPPNEYRGKPFWAWNGRLEPDELRRQVRVMHRMGLGGFFMHSRVGLDTEYLGDDWFECIRACIDEGEKLGMEAWLYDEDRWPSGPAGGLVTRHEEYRMRLLLVDVLDQPRQLKWNPGTLAAFTARLDGTSAFDVERIARGKRPRLTKGRSIVVFTVGIAANDSWYNGYTYLDVLNPRAVKKFIDVTHEAYRKKIAKHFGKAVPGIFTDEPNHGGSFCSWPTHGRPNGIPWTNTLPAVFKKRYRYDIVPHLMELFFDVNAEAITPARHDYHDCTTFMFTEAFARQIGQWCDKNNLLHTGHVLCESPLGVQTSFVGSSMRFYEYMQAPGIDMLGEYRHEFDTAKQTSSAANQFGLKWRLTETYGCTGWDFPFAGHKATGDWQAALGMNLRCQHLSLYTMEAEAKRDYPASILHQSPWWQVYGKVEGYFARVHVAMTRGREVRDLLVIHPVESMWMMCKKPVQAPQPEHEWFDDSQVNQHERSLLDLRNTLLADNIDFDYADEDILARHGKVSRARRGPELVVGKAAYKAVVVPPLLTVRKTTLRLLARFKAAGGAVIFAGNVAEYVDATKSTAAADLAAGCAKAPPKGVGLITAVEPTCRRVSITDAEGRQIAPALYLLRADNDASYLFVCNLGYDLRKAPPDGVPLRRCTKAFEDVRIRGFASAAGQPLELDPQTGEIFAADAKSSGGEWEIRTSLPRQGSRLFVIPQKRGRKTYPKRAKLRDLKTHRLNPRKWDIVLSECNNLVLDRPRYRIGRTRWRKADDVLRIDQTVRDAIGIEHRGGAMVQPWAQVKPKTKKAIPVELDYTFTVKAAPSADLFLGIERPELYRMSVNGTPLSAAAECGWWTDKSLRKIPIDPSLLTFGENRLTLACDYDQDHPGLETVYLLGAFGTSVAGTDVAITPVPTSLKLGDWGKQGLAFYSGAVSYRRAVPTKLRKNHRLFVQVPAYAGAAVRVLVNGRAAGVIAWEPNEVDITDFVDGEQVDLAVEIISHRRNSHGPLHLRDKYPQGIGPYQFIPPAAERIDGYQLVPCGLLEPPRLVVRR